MRKATPISFGVLSMGIALAAQDLRAQDRPQGGGEAYGPGAQYLVVPAPSFRPLTSAGTFTFTGGYFTAPAGGGFFAPVELPAGASVVNVCAETYDVDGVSEINVQWVASEGGDSTGSPAYQVLGNGTTGAAATPGYALTCVDLATPTLIRKFQDLDGNGHSGNTWYALYVNFTGFSSNLRVGGGVITWLRTVSPAPAAATFGDVPTNFLYFRAIEALAASGITGGCGNGNFCPNQYVTRGEIAAFFARALGLHWPL